MKNKLIVTVGLTIITLTGCTSYGKCPTPPKLEQPVYAIYDLPENAVNSDKAKAGAISWRQCNTALDKCTNSLDKYR